MSLTSVFLYWKPVPVLQDPVMEQIPEDVLRNMFINTDPYHLELIGVRETMYVNEAVHFAPEEAQRITQIALCLN